MATALVTDGIVILWISVLSVWDRVLDGVVNLNATEPLTALGSFNAGALAEIAINVVDSLAKLVQLIVLAAQTRGLT